MHRSHSFLAVALAVCALPAPSAFAQSAQPQVDGVKILELLVAKGVIQREEADALIAQARIDPPSVPAADAAEEGQLVAHVPEPVRRQIKDELRTEVMQQAQQEGWAAPGETAEWTQRIKVSGDIRSRGESVSFDKPRFDRVTGEQVSGNFLLFPNFNEINAGNGFDVNGLTNAPFLNTSADRQRGRVRARLGVEAKLTDWITADLRVATGSDNSPVSTNQTLGASGELGHYELWVDRAGIRLAPLDWLQISAGRSANPFWSSDLLFDEDLNFDGLSLRSELRAHRPLRFFSTLGAFPIYNTSFDFGSTETTKTKSRDKYMFGAQLGLQFKPSNRFGARLAASYFDFKNLTSELSSPCLAVLDVCDTDLSRPRFVQFGNTLAPIRNLLPDPNNPDGPQRQYYGLAADFRIVDVHAQLEYSLSGGAGVRLTGDVVRNIDYDPMAVTLRGPVNNLGDAGEYRGGDDGWYANIIIGYPDVVARGTWNLSVGYKYLESDAVVDAFTDSDFHMGGTNAEGYIIGGEYAFSDNALLGLRWLSANEISGPPFAVDVLQLDLLTRF